MSKLHHPGGIRFRRICLLFIKKRVVSRVSLSMLGVVSVFAVDATAKASAETIPMLRNSTTGETIFNDDFEIMTVPPAPEALPAPTFGTPLVGTWTAAGETNMDNLVVGVTNEARSGVAPQQGDNFFVFSTAAGPVTGQTWTGKGGLEHSWKDDEIEANIAFYLTADSNRAFFYLYGGIDQNRLLAAFCLNGKNPLLKDYSLSYHNGEAFQQTQLRFKPDAWNTLKVKHTNGTSTWEVSINDGKHITVTGYQDATDLYVNAIFLNQTTDSSRGTTVYFDAVASNPESTPKGK